MNSTNQETKLKTFPGPWSLGEMTGNWRDIDLPDHGGVMRIVWKMEDDEGRNDALEAQAHAVVAALNAASSSTPPAEQQAPRCSYCDGTGDVHGIDGEWRGICTECDAGTALRQQAAPKAAPGEPDGFGSAEHWKEKAQYWAGVAHRLRGEALRGEPVDGIVHPPAPQQEAQAPAPSAAVFGLRLVPVEPTDQMVQAAHHIDLSYMPGQEGADRAAIYRAMIAAAPGERCQHCIDRHDGIYGSWAAPCPYHDDDGKPRPTANTAPQQEAQEPAAFIHWPINGPPRLVWYSQKALNDAILKTHEDGYKPDVKLYTAPQPAPAPVSEPIDQLARKLEIIGVVGVVDGHDVVRRESVLEIARRAAIAAQGGK